MVTWASGYLLGSVETSLKVTIVGGYILCHLGEMVLVHLKMLVASLSTSQEISWFIAWATSLEIIWVGRYLSRTMCSKEDSI
jgi:hypothetical protein